MTAAETKTLEALRADLASYHVEVREHIARFEACDGAVQGLQADVYGLPGEREEGILGAVADLQHSRKLILRALKAAWAAILLVAGAWAEKFFSG